MLANCPSKKGKFAYHNIERKDYEQICKMLVDCRHVE